MKIERLISLVLLVLLVGCSVVLIKVKDSEGVEIESTIKEEVRIDSLEINTKKKIKNGSYIK